MWLSTGGSGFQELGWGLEIRVSHFGGSYKKGYSTFAYC